ncbi:MAG: DUF2225 domain-containing protein, partial [Cyanobacteria bacterium NC_groundwater_1444_Ag_S-0.65um_54_12]|nr:DUF2225 domain-containing protein [Cyanobacteria bacterium NC_groundwater_1444_Ag_S-0.65um_54_12]
MATVLVKREVNCPLCKLTFVYHTPKSHTYSLIKRDSDFCPYYKGVNPLFYLIYICPGCHFAAYKRDFKDLEDRSRQALIDLLNKDSRGLAVDFHQAERSLFAALRSYQLALSCYTARRFPPDILASVALRASWLCRYSGELKRELSYSELARDYYQQAFEKGIRADRQVDDLAIALLIGELMLRTGQIAAAMRYFMFLVRTKDAKSNLEQSARNRLYDSKQALKIKKILEDIELFVPMGEQGLGVLAVNTEIRSVKPGVRICSRGEPGESMFIIVNGKVSIFLDDPAVTSAVAILGP